MVEIQVDVPDNLIEPTVIANAVRLAVEESSLNISVETSLAMYSGSLHWHLKNPGRTGTLEVSAIPGQSRIWVCYHDNRVGDGWVGELAPALAAHITRLLANG